MKLSSALNANEGFATRAALASVGFSARRIRGEIAAGRLVPYGRNIVARPVVKETLRRAVSMSGRIACVTAAREMGLWVLDEEAFHVVPRSLNSHFSPDKELPAAVVHWSPEPIEPDRHRIASESGRNALMHIARCQPLDAAVATFDSAVRQGFVTIEELQQLASVHGGRFARVVGYVSDKADSGLESLTRVRLAFAGIACAEQVVLIDRPVDLLIGARLVIQLDGKHHGSDPRQHTRDRKFDRRLRKMGYTVLRYGYAEVVFEWPKTMAEILALMAQNAQLPAGA